MALLSIIYIVRRFWFLRGWQLIGALAAPAPRYLLHGLLVIAAAAVLVSILDPMLGHFIPRQGVGHWVVATSRVWLLASLFGYLVVSSVGVMEFISKPALYAFPPAQRQGIDESRRTFFHYAAITLGSLKVIQERIGHAFTGSFTLDVYGGKPEWKANLEAARLLGVALEDAVNATAQLAESENFGSLTTVGGVGPNPESKTAPQNGEGTIV